MTLILAAMLISGMANAALIDRGRGLIFDTVLNITWTQRAGDRELRDWADANAWAANLVFGGFDDWRLPSMDVNGDGRVVQCETNLDCSDNEYGHMFYQNLNGAFLDDKTADQVGDGGVTFRNIDVAYWSGTEVEPNSSFAWAFLFIDGRQVIPVKEGLTLSGWAMRSGDVFAVPEPGSLALVGMAGLALALTRGAKRRR